MSASQSQLNYTQSMYIAYYGRAADPGGLGYWVGRLGVEGAAGIAAAFGNSAEFNENYGALSNTELVNGLFLQLFGRAADTGGLAFYSAGLESGEFTLPDVALRIIDGVRPGSGDDLIVANRVDVANVVTNLAPTSPLRDSILDAVGGDSRSVDTALESLGITLEDRGRFNLTIGESDGKVGIDSAVLLTPRTAESGDILGLDVLRADPRFANIDGSGYTVVVLDTGIDLNHPAFGPDSDGDGVSDRIVYHQDFSDDGDGTADDVNGHGSNVASIIGSSSGAFEGVAPGVNIIALQVLGNAGGGSFDGIQRALQWVVENQSAFNIVAVNLSLGTSTNANSPQLDVLADEFAALAALGVISIAAAGNDYFSFQAPGVGYPASDPNVIAVGATFDANVGPQGWADGAEAFSTAVDVIVPFSQRSTLLTPIFAPGATITGAAPGGGTAGQTGTSQAAPQIAGVAALAQQIADQELGRRLSPTEFLSLLSSSAVTIVDGDDENDNVLNSGASFSRVDVVALANAIASLDDGAAPAPAPTQDAIPGDTTTQATLVLGEVTQGAIDSREDRDWFRVDLEAGENYAFSLNGVTLSDPWLGLFDPAGVFITSNNDAGGTSNSALSFTPTASGTFFLSAEAFSASQTGSYVIEALLATFANSDGIPGDASSSEALAVNASVSSSIDFGGDQDWLLLDLQAGVTYTIDVSGSTSGGGTLMDPTLEVFSSASEAVAFNDDGGPGLEPSLIFTPNASGSFFAAVRAFGADDTGSYTVSISADEDVDAIPGDASTGATLVAGENLTNSIDFADDQDWFAVTLTAGEQYEFNLTGDGPNALADPFLALFDANGGPEALAIDDDGGDGRNARLAFAPDSTGTYFVAASAFGPAIGDYSLLLSAGVMGREDDTINSVPIGDAGNSRDEATAITLDDGEAQASGSTGFADDSADFFSFTAAASGLADFSLTGLTADLDLVLEDASGQVIASGFEGAASDESFSATVQSGTSYVLRVDPYGSAASEYSLALNLPASSVAGREEAINGSATGDAPDTLEAAMSLPASGAVEILGSTGFGGDAGDLFALTAAGDGNATFSLSELRADLDIALLSSTGAILASSSINGNGAEFFDFPLIADTDYFVWVLPFTGASEYRLDIQLPAGASDGTDVVNGADIGDAQDDTNTGTTVILNGEGDAHITGSTGFANDAGDFYRFQASDDGFASFSLRGLSDDLDLELFSGDGTSIAYLPAVDSDAEYLALNLIAGESYIVGVYPWDSAQSDYNLLIDTETSMASGDSINGIDIGDAGSALDPAPVAPDVTGQIAITGSAGFGNDLGDAFSVTAVSASQGSTDNEVLITLSNIAAGADLDLYISNSSGEPLAVSTNGDNLDEGLQAVLVAGEQYIIEVYAYSGASTYTLDIQGLSIAGSADQIAGVGIGDAPDSTASAYDATLALDIAGDVSIEGSVGFDDDDGDFYAFTAAATGNLYLDLTDLQADIDLYLRDPIGNILDGSTLGGASSEAIGWSVTAGETYIVSVNPYDDAESEYELEVNFITPAMDDSVNGVVVDGFIGTEFTDLWALAVPESPETSIVIEGTTGSGFDNIDIFEAVSPGTGEITVNYEVSVDTVFDLRDYTRGTYVDGGLMLADAPGSLTFDVELGTRYGLEIYASEHTEYRLEVSAPDPDSAESGPDDFINGIPIGDASDSDALPTTLAVPATLQSSVFIVGSTGFDGDSADAYSVISPATGEITVEYEVSSALSVTVIDGFGTELFAETILSEAPGEFSIDVNTGVLYILKLEADPGSNYSFEVSAPDLINETGGNDMIVGDAEPFGDAGDSILDSWPILLNATGDTRISGSTGFDTDESDFYVLLAEDAGVATIRLTGLTDDLELTAYDGFGSPVDSSSNTGSNPELLSFNVDSMEAYVIAVTPLGDAESSYDLIVDFPPTAGTFSGDFVNGESVGELGDLFSPYPAQQDAEGDIRVAGYVEPGFEPFDALLFTAQENTELNVELYFGASSDLDVALYDPAGALLAASTNDEYGASEFLVYDLTAGEQYIIEVTAFEGNGAEYFLNLLM